MASVTPGPAATSPHPVLHRTGVGSGLGGAARGGAFNLVGAGYAALAGFGTATVVARGLSPADAGVFFSATALFVVGTVVARLGTPTGLVYWLTRLRTLGAPGLIRQCLVVALRPVVAGSVLLAAAAYLAAPWLGGTEAPSFTEQVRILAVLLPLAAVSEALLGATRGHRTMRPTVLIEKLTRPTLQLAGLAAALWLGATTGWYTLAWAAPWTVTVVLGWLWLRRLLSPAGATPTGATPAGPVPAGATLWRAFWEFTWPRGVANVLQLMLRRLDVLLVAGLLGFAAAAGYAVATRFSVVGQLGNTAVGSAVEPRLAEAVARGDDPAARRLYQTATGWLVLTTWPVYLLTAGFAPLYLQLFGPAYRTGETVAVVLLLCVAMLVASGCGMVDVVLAMAGRTTANLANVSTALVVNVGLNLLLIPRIGIAGAGVAWAAGVLVKNLLPLVQLVRRRGLHPYGAGTLIAAGLAAGCFGVLPLLLATALGRNPPTLLAAAGVGTLCYLAGLWWLRGPLRLSAFRRARTREDV